LESNKKNSKDMELTKKMIIGLPGSCGRSQGIFASLNLPETFTARQAVDAYLAAWGNVPDIARSYGAMVAAGLAPDTGAIWKIARLAFLVQAEESGLREWAEKLGPDNWREANAHAKTYAAEAGRIGLHQEGGSAARAADAAEAASSTGIYMSAAYAATAGYQYAAHYAADSYARTALRAMSADTAGDEQGVRILEIIFNALGE
jgi:hypothetical protein